MSKLGTAVVTGASSGIGKVYAQRLAARGYDLILVARRKDRLETVAADLQSRFAIRAETLVADLGQETGLAEVVRRISDDASITFLVNNAGFAAIGPVSQTSPAAMHSLVAVNITALTALTMAILPTFVARNAGTIVNIGSAAGFAPFAVVPIYGPTKAYVRQFTQCLQQEVQGTGVRVQLVSPASTVTEGFESLGIPPALVDPATLMTTEDCVDAALKGLDNGEFNTAPSLHDESLLQQFEEASMKLLMATQTGQPAPRYTQR
jgi:short-subunit dehydrogenase